MRQPSDVLIGLEAGATAIVAAAFGPTGRQIAHVETPHPPSLVEGGGVEQDLGATWQACARTLRLLADRVPDLARRTIALALTGQAGGTWLIDEDGDPVAPAMLGCDRRAAAVVERWSGSPIGPALRARTGSPLSAGTQSAQVAWLAKRRPELLARAASVLHAKDWLHFCFTGVRASEPSQAVPAWGDVRTGAYDPGIPRLIGLEDVAPLLPELVDVTRHHAPLGDVAAAATGLWSGTPVVLGPVDVAAAALAMGLSTDDPEIGGTLLGPAGAHLRAHGKGVPINLPITGTLPWVRPDTWLSYVADLASAGWLDWLPTLCEELLAEAGLIGIARSDLIDMLDRKAAQAPPGATLHLPLPGATGQPGGPLSAEFTALPNLCRAVYEAIGFVARDAFATLDLRPREVRLAGALAPRERATLDRVLAACVSAPVRRLDRAAPAATGAALVAAVALGHYANFDSARPEWVDPWLGAAEDVDPALEVLYDRWLEDDRRAHRPRAARGHPAAAAKLAG